MELTDIKLKYVKYYMSQLTINAGGTSFDVPRAMLGGLVFNKDYDNSIYPFVYLSCSLPGWFYQKVALNSNSITITMDLKAALFQNEINERSPSPFSVYKGTYKAVCAIDSPTTDIDRQIKVEADEGSKNKSYQYSEAYMVEFNLYNASSYEASFSTKPNTIITSANMTAIVAYVMNEGGLKNILMSKLSNTKTYREFKVPPVTCVQEMKNLIHCYGLHQNGTIFFMDLDRAYLINKSTKCEAWVTNEYKSVHIMTFDQYNEALTKFSGYYENSKEKYHVLGVAPENVQSVALDNSKSKLLGYNKILEITTQDAIFDALTPNKSYVVNVNNSIGKSVNGTYRISRVNATFKPGGEYLNPSFQIVLIK